MQGSRKVVWRFPLGRVLSVQMHGSLVGRFTLGEDTTGGWFAKHKMSESIVEVLAKLPRIGTGYRSQVDFLAVVVAVDFSGQFLVRSTGSGTQSVGTAFRRLATSRERRVECLVVEDQDLSWLHPVDADLAIVKDDCADKFAPHPFDNDRMFPEFGAERVLEVERNFSACQLAHDCVHAAEELVG